MAVVLTCPKCGQQSSIGEEHAGKKSVCPFCNTLVVIPSISGMAAYGSPEPRRVRAKSGGPGWIIVVIALVCAIPCMALMVALLLPAVQAAREAGHRTQCINKEHQLGFAMMNYASTYNHFPPAATGAPNGGNAMSWRVALLPFMGYAPMYKSYDKSKPWDDPANAAVLDAMPQAFRCPSDSINGPNETSYFMVTGPGTVGGPPGSTGASLLMTNGLSQTFLIVEVPGMHIPWTRPKDITLAELAERITEQAPNMHPNGFNVTFCDGSVKFQPVYNLDVETLKKMASTGNSDPVATRPVFNRPGFNQPGKRPMRKQPVVKQPADDADDDPLAPK